MKFYHVLIASLLSIIFIALCVLIYITFIPTKATTLSKPYYLYVQSDPILLKADSSIDYNQYATVYSTVDGAHPEMLSYQPIAITGKGKYEIQYRLDTITKMASIVLYEDNDLIDPENIEPILIEHPEQIDVLVNRYYTLASDYIPNDLVVFNNYEMRQIIVDPLSQMIQDASREGIVLSITSAYRSYQTQSNLFYNYIQISGRKQAIQYSAFPGRSEHQLGLAIDFISNDTPSLSQEMGNRPSGIWLSNHAYKYGFIVRYEENKSDITGYMYEPWHVRYVGVELATLLHDNQWSFEEYMFYTKQDASYIIGK